MATEFQRFAIIGGGAWGTALALSLLRAGRDVTFVVRDASVAEDINFRHRNTKRLPDSALDDRLRATTDISALAECNALILATPAQQTRAVCKLVLLHQKNTPIIISAKGLEQKSSQMLEDVVQSEMPSHPVALISGPSFAGEVAEGLPTALTLAIRDLALGENLAGAMATPTFRLYLTNDMAGVQIGGAVKNVLAIACGIVVGRKLGDNARAALMTRGMAELMRLGLALGARRETLMGLSGMGDLVLTCGSPQSRNMALGMALGQGKTLAECMAAHSYVTEGVATAEATLTLARQHNVEMPVIEAVSAILGQGAEIDTMIAALLSRPLKAEEQ